MTDIERTSSMRIVLIGNGIEIEFQENMRKEKIIENVLNKVVEHNGRLYRSQFPYALKEFIKKINKGLMLPKPDQLIMESNLNNENQNKSVEQIYVDLETSGMSEEGKKALEPLFLSYLDQYSNEIPIEILEEDEEILTNENNKGRPKIVKNKVNFIKKKLDTYDLVLTTNYTKFLSRNLNNENKIVYLHGKIDDKENAPVLGKLKSENYKGFNQALNNLKEALGKIETVAPYLDKTQINLDIYGWSLENEYDLIYLIICECLLYLCSRDMRTYKSNNYNRYVFYPEESEKKPTFEDLKQKRIVINYYVYHQEDQEYKESIDFRNFEKYLKEGHGQDREHKNWLRDKKIKLYKASNSEQGYQGYLLFSSEIDERRYKDNKSRGVVTMNSQNTKIILEWIDLDLNIDALPFDYKNFGLTKSKIEETRKKIRDMRCAHLNTNFK